MTGVSQILIRLYIYHRYWNE